MYEFDYVLIYSSFIIIGLNPIFPNPCLLSFVLLMEILQSTIILHFQIIIVISLTPKTKNHSTTGCVATFVLQPTIDLNG